MIVQPQIRGGTNREAGYALMMMMVLLALMVLASVAVAPNVLTAGKREKEKELVWRGKQYVRGIRLYYQKFHRFPTSLDDLTQPKTGIRMMRQAYKEPMNSTDGSWRLIYVGPNGQLIGSLKNRNISMGGVGGMGMTSGQQPGSAFGTNTTSNSSFGSNTFGNSSFGNSSFGNSSFGNSTGTASATNQNQGGFGSMGSQTPSSTTTTTQDPNNPNSSDQMGVPHDLGTMDASSVIGGNIIGVASKVDQKSILWYDKAKTYKLFEFIWDPSKDNMVGAASTGIGIPLQTNGPNNTPGTGLTGTTPTQPPQQNQNFNPNPDPNPTPPLQAPPLNP
jgi:hypothetical protein